MAKSRYVKYKREIPLNYRDLTITRLDVQRFLDAVTHKSPCPECGRDHWRITLTPGQDDRLAITTVTESEDREADSYVAVAMLMCSTCGFVKLHALKSIAKWLASEKETQDEEVQDDDNGP